jgi:hypothetical protein
MRPHLLMTQFALLTIIGTYSHTGHAADGASAGAVTEAEDEAALELKDHHRHHHLGGVTQFVAMSLDTLAVGDALASKVDTLQAALYSCMAPAGAVEHDILLSIASGVEAGRIDQMKVDADIDRLNAAAVAVHDCGTDPLNRLHGLLDTATRETLVDKVLAHWEVWQQVNHLVEGGTYVPGDHLGQLSRDLGLSTKQRDDIADGLRQAHAGPLAGWDVARADAQLKAFASTFAGKSFDARSLTVDADAHIAKRGAMRMAAFFEVVAPVLTPPQRSTLAGHLRERASQQPMASAK